MNVEDGGKLYERILALEAKDDKPEVNSEGKGALAYISTLLAAAYTFHDADPLLSYGCIGVTALVMFYYMHIRFQLKLKGKEV